MTVAHRVAVTPALLPRSFPSVHICSRPFSSVPLFHFDEKRNLVAHYQAEKRNFEAVAHLPLLRFDEKRNIEAVSHYQAKKGRNIEAVDHHEAVLSKLPIVLLSQKSLCLVDRISSSITPLLFELSHLLPPPGLSLNYPHFFSCVLFDFNNPIGLIFFVEMIPTNFLLFHQNKFPVVDGGMICFGFLDFCHQMMLINRRYQNRLDIL